MRRIVTCVLLLVAIVPAVGAPAPLPKRERPDERPDLERLQGRWELVRMVDHRDRAAPTEAIKAVMRITGNRCRTQFGDGDVAEDSIITIDPKSTPKRMTLRHPDGDNSAFVEATTALCIYRLQGNTLTIRIDGGKDGRPRDFTTPPRSKSASPDIMIFQRSKGHP